MGTSSSSSSDVFISFRGVDTRQHFIKNLYKALTDKRLRAFIHDYEDIHINEEEVVKLSHFKAIEECKICIVVLSPNYAASSLCLDELVKIVECSSDQQAGGESRLVLPVFYGVNPSDVRHRRGRYGEAIANQEDDDMEKLTKWKEALLQVAQLAGYVVNPAEVDENIIINKIVDTISTKVHQTQENARNVDRIKVHQIQEKARRYVGIASIVAGLVCYALSSSFNRLYGEWNSLKISVYILSSFIIYLFISFPDLWRHWRIFQYKAHVAFLVLISTTCYSYYYDHKLKGKPDEYGVSSSVAFATMSLCMSKKVASGFLDLMYYFCGVMITQLVEMEPKLGLVGVGSSYVLITLRSYLDGTKDDEPQDNTDLEEILTE